VLSLGADLDDIPQASQVPGVACHLPLVDGAPGHGEGHNAGPAVNIVAALAVKRIMERDHLPGTLKIWPGVAEELGGGKAFLVRAGYFKDTDIVLFAHVASALETGWGDTPGTGNISVLYSFKGQSAHAAAAPWRGRSALDAVELMDVGWNFRREHLRPAQRSHYVIKDGGDQPNVVPSTASVWYYLRELDGPHIAELFAIADSIARGAALMTGTSLASERILGSAWPGHFNKVVAQTMYENIKQVGLPKWSEADQTLARAVQRELHVAEQGLDTTLAPLPAPPTEEQRHAGFSDDIGDVSWNVPTVVLLYPVQYPQPPGAQLVERDHDGDAYRAQGRERGREGPSDDAARLPVAARARPAGVGLLSHRPDEDDPLHATDPARGPAGARAERRHHGEVPARNAQVLLRADEVRDVPGAVERHLPHAAPVGRTVRGRAGTLTYLPAATRAAPSSARAGRSSRSRPPRSKTRS
jgi:amidohydrolase